MKLKEPKSVTEFHDNVAFPGPGVATRPVGAAALLMVVNAARVEVVLPTVVAVTDTKYVVSVANPVRRQYKAERSAGVHVAATEPPVRAVCARTVYEVTGFHIFDAGASHCTNPVVDE
jgi:hypothetical protein